MTAKKYKTGDINNKKQVYIEFPKEYENMSGFYSYEEVEEYASKYFIFMPLVKKYINEEYRNAIIELYKANNRDIPSRIKKFLGKKK